MPVDHYENFPVASLLLPKPLRHPVEVIYRFARSADDLADEGDASPAERLAALAAYQEELDRIDAGQTPSQPMFQALAQVIRQWHLPIELFHDLLSAFIQDVTVSRYPDYPTLLDYCRRSANPVGRLLLHLFDRASSANLERSDAICTALQLANFWQDIAIDWRKNRVYLPQDELARFQIDESQIAAGTCSPDWTALLDFQIDRTQALMLAGAPLCRDLPGRVGWEIRLTAEGGLRILEQTRRVRGDIFRQRPTLQGRDWPLLLWRAVSRPCYR